MFGSAMMTVWTLLSVGATVLMALAPFLIWRAVRAVARQLEAQNKLVEQLMREGLRRGPQLRSREPLGSGKPEAAEFLC